MNIPELIKNLNRLDGMRIGIAKKCYYGEAIAIVFTDGSVAIIKADVFGDTPEICLMKEMPNSIAVELGFMTLKESQELAVKAAEKMNRHAKAQRRAEYEKLKREFEDPGQGI